MAAGFPVVRLACDWSRRRRGRAAPGRAARAGADRSSRGPRGDRSSLRSSSLSASTWNNMAIRPIRRVMLICCPFPHPEILQHDLPDPHPDILITQRWIRGGLRLRRTGGGAVQQLDDLVVGDLAEVVIPLAHRVEEHPLRCDPRRTSEPPGRPVLPTLAAGPRTPPDPVVAGQQSPRSHTGLSPSRTMADGGCGSTSRVTARPRRVT